MSASPTSRTEALFAAITGVLQQDSGDAALERAAEACATLSAAAVSALFLFDGDSAQGDAWFPSRDDVDTARRTALRRAARALFAAPSEPTAAEPPGGPVLTTFPLLMSGRALGALCLLHPPDAAALRVTDWRPDVERLLLAIAPLFSAQMEAARAAAARSQYERWFKTLDEQVRVLDRERQKFAAIVHQSDAHVYVADPQGTIRWTNAVLAAEPLASPERSSWIGLSCHDVCVRFGATGRGPCEDCPTRRAVDSLQVEHRELHSTDGAHVRNHYMTALPIKGPDGRPHEVMVMVQDLSDLNVLRRSEARYRVLFERSAKALIMVDPANRCILLANPLACRLTGRSAEALMQLRLEDLHGPAEWARLQARYAAGFAERSLASLECCVLGSGQVDRLATVSGTRVDLDGQDVVMLEFQDMTESRRVEQALRSAEERLHTVIGNAPVIMFAIDAEGRFTISEGRGLETLGLRAGEVVGRSVYEVYAEVPTILDNVRRALAGEAFTAVVEFGRLAFETRYAPLRDEAHGVTGVIGVATDVTERRRLEDELRQSHKMEAIGRLAGGVAHDFNNLLAAILGHSELLVNRVDPHSPLRSSVEEIQKAGQRGALLTRQLLAFSRKQGITPQILDLALVVEEMDGLLRRLIGEDIELVTRCGAPAALTLMDRGHLEQIVMNLVVNGRDALPGGGQLILEVDLAEVDAQTARESEGLNAGSYVVLAVSDNGCGMEPDTLRHAFEPFFTTKHAGKGTGLGLSTVQAIVEQSGGSIMLSSQPGLGTTIRVYLPRALASESTPVDLPRPKHAPGHESVLLVEDEDAVRAMAADLLRSRGYTVIEARHGAEAIQRVRESGHAVDLLVTDVVMPQIGGGELAQRMRLIHPQLPVLFMSGYPDDSGVRHGALSQGSLFLEKPFTLDALALGVRALLDRAESDREARAA